MNELFTIQPQDSPMLAWLKKHRVSTKHNESIEPDEECLETGETLFPWCAFVGANTFPKPDGLMGCGNTEHEAIVDLAIKRGLKLWNETL
jgi:hypothetical protein